jgi:VanZ family protein
VKKLFFLCVSLIAYFTLHPWTFVPFAEHTTILEGFRPLVGKSEYLDIVVNLCFFVPLGVLGVLAWWKGSGTAGRWIALTAFGAALSCTLEVIQAWVPGRDSSVLDILTNTIGTVAGMGLGLAIAGRLPSSSRKGTRWAGRPMPAALIVAWLLSQWFPFLPILRIPRFVASLHALMQVSSLGWIDLADAFVAALLVGRLVREVLTPTMSRLALVGACLVLPARLFIVVGAAPWPLAVAFAAGLVVSDRALAGLRAEPRALATIAVLLIVVRELQPFQFGNTAGSFYWVPFSGFLGSTRDSAIRVSSEKFFLYGATVWMIREAGISLWTTAAGVGGLLLAGEFAQRYLPGRIAESTDPVLAVTAACVMVWLKDRPATRPPAAAAASGWSP